MKEILLKDKTVHLKAKCKHFKTVASSGVLWENFKRQGKEGFQEVD